MGSGSEALKQMKIAGARVGGIMHIGASDGQERWEYQAAGNIPVIYVEPIDTNFANLQRNIAEMPGHIAVQALCSDAVGQRIALNIASNNGESSSIFELGRHADLFPSVTYVAKQEMTTTSVDALLGELSLPSEPNLLVLATQGSELKVLKGAKNTLRSVDGLYVEVSENPLYEGGCTHEEITKYLKPYGFRMRWLAVWGMGVGDAFYLKAPQLDAERARPADDGAESVSLIEALSLLTPFEIDRAKQRIGPQQDGGYVLIPELFSGQPVLSYGIAGDYDFDIEMASRGHPVYMFDHTIAGIETPDPKLGLIWIKQGVAGRTDKEQLLDTIENQLHEYAPFGNDLILKMDVEGCEYDAFEALPRDQLRRFQQIVFEIHTLHSLPDPVFRARYLRVLRKLNRDFTLFHVHANNFDGENTYGFIAGVPVANLLELSYVRSDLVNRSPSETLYPTGIDFPNVHPHDKKLWFFPFLPTTVSLAEFLGAERRMNAIAASIQSSRAQTVVEQCPDIGSTDPTVVSDSGLRSTRDLVNVALRKPAVQSTLSIWSGNQGAAGLVNGNFGQNFGIHTDIEDAPWVSVDLLRSVPVEAIIVHNRRDGFQDRARSLRIEISTDGSDWTIVHSGLCHFGSVGNGIPLVIPLSNRLWARYVRLSLEERNFLCISQLEVIADRSQIRLMDIREAHSLECPLFGEHPGRDPHECYTLTSPDHSWEKPLVGLELNENGAFGNCMIQYANAVILAQRLGLRYIKISSNDRSELIRLERPLVIDGLTFIPAMAPFPDEGVFLRGSFFDNLMFARVVGHISSSEFHEVIRKFVKRILNVLPEEFGQKPTNELLIHIRSGDVFKDWVNPHYVQPPLSFYTTIVDRLIRQGEVGRVRLVFENRLNPVIDALELFLLQNGIPFSTQSGSISQDVEALVNGRQMLFGLGTFGPAICHLSNQVDRIFFFAPGASPGFSAIPSVHEAFEVIDGAGRYINAGEWRNTPEQRELMVSYPAENLIFPWSETK